MSYIVRIELASKVIINFMALHSAMESRGFKRTILADGGIEYHLPRATYHIETSSNENAVLQAARHAVNSTGKSAEILVIAYRNCIFDLKPVVKNK